MHTGLAACSNVHESDGRSFTALCTVETVVAVSIFQQETSSDSVTVLAAVWLSTGFTAGFTKT